MSLRALRHFVVVAEELHMHRAAERLHIAQPALSQQIKQLEQRLGVVLFSRANRRLTLTAAGEAFLQKTRLALEMADQAVLDAQRTARGEQGRLHLGYVSSAMYDSKLPGLLRELRADWPGIELSLVQGDVQMLYEALLDLRLDIAIIRAPLASPPDALVVRPFVRENFAWRFINSIRWQAWGRSIWPRCALTTGSRLTIRRAPDWSRYLLTPVASRVLRRRWCSELTMSPR